MLKLYKVSSEESLQSLWKIIFSKQENTSYFIKADSGCLGMMCRRRTCKTAKVVGELSRSSDPAVSEWGSPNRGNTVDTVLRTEISNYKFQVTNKFNFQYIKIDYYSMFVPC